MNQNPPLIKYSYLYHTRWRRTESNAAIADLTGNSLRIQRQVAELGQRSISRKQEYRKEVEKLLADVTREVRSDAEKFVAVTAALDRMEI